MPRYKLHGLKHLRTSVVVLFSLISVANAQSLSHWQIEVVDKSDSKGASMYTSLAIDRYGSLHLAFSGRGGSELRYAFRKANSGRWDVTTVDSNGGVFDSLAVDSRGWAQIAYNSPRVPGLHYAMWNGQKWQTMVLDPVRTGHETSIQVDSHDYPHISYYREAYSDLRTARDLKYAYFDGKRWYIQTVDHRFGAGKWNSIALDRSGQPSISYSMTSPGNLGFAHLTESVWDRSFVDPMGTAQKRYMDGANSLAVDAAGNPHIAFIDFVQHTVNYGWLEGANWHQETVDSLVSAGADSDRISLKLDKLGQPHLAYYDPDLGVLKYATRDNTNWQLETVDDAGAGGYASLWLDGEGQPYISYSTPREKEIRIAHRTVADVGSRVAQR